MIKNNFYIKTSYCNNSNIASIRICILNPKINIMMCNKRLVLINNKMSIQDINGNVDMAIRFRIVFKPDGIPSYSRLESNRIFIYGSELNSEIFLYNKQIYLKYMKIIVSMLKCFSDKISND